MADKKDAGSKEAPKKEDARLKDVGHRVRILTTDIDGSKELLVGIARIKGVGHNLANAILNQLTIDKKKKLYELTDGEIETIEQAISDPSSLGVPTWMYNRQKDLDTGKDIHVNTSDLTLVLKSDFDLMGEMKSYKGLRHPRGLKLRGQRTKSTGRGKSAVGVQRKKK